MGFVDCIQGRRPAARKVQHPYQWQTHWVLHPSTAEAPKHEKNLFMSCAGLFATADRPQGPSASRAWPAENTSS